MKTTIRGVGLTLCLAAFACSSGPESQDLGNLGGGKADFQSINNLPIYVAAKDKAYLTFRGSGAFTITVTQPESTAVMRLQLTENDEVVDENDASATEQTLEIDPGDSTEHAYTLQVWNRSYTKDLHGMLSIEPVEGGPANPAGLQYNSYKVLFTNPICAINTYSSPIPTADGQGERVSKPENVYCQYSDTEASGARPSSPQYQLVEWVNELAAGDELFLAYLSYSNQTVGTALCEAAERGAHITFVLDAPTTRSDELEACGGTVLIRGHQGGIGYAHNKIFLVNPNGDSTFMKMAFSSGNMSSGAVTHHENWHFIEVNRKSYFAESHRCLMNAQIDELASSSKANYGDAIEGCRDAIPYAPESDIRAFFIPNGADSQAATDAMKDGIATAATISMGAHRFSYPTMIDALADRLETDTSVSIRLVADDDLYWLNPWGGGAGFQPGNNLAFEADNVERLWLAGDKKRFQVKYLETNHNSHLLHHNKFLIFEDMADKPDGVLCGAANLTGTGFWDNFENIYYIEVPEVVDAFKTQYGRFWDGEKGSSSEPEPPRATAPWDMPERDVAP